MQLRSHLGVPAVIAVVLVLTLLSIVALVYGVILISFGTGTDRAWALLLVPAAFAGFVVAIWLGTGRPPRWSGGRRDRVHERHLLGRMWRR